MKKNKWSAYGKFFTIVIQMAVLIIIGVFGGQYLDQMLELSTPWFTILCSLVAVFLGLYLLIREVIKMNK